MKPARCRFASLTSSFAVASLAITIVLALASDDASAQRSQRRPPARGGVEGGNGGDMCESRIASIRDGILDWIIEADGTHRIVCNRSAFMKSTTVDDQYVLIHHEYAGLSGIEVNDGDRSTYGVSNQLTGFMTSSWTRRLAVRAVDLSRDDENVDEAKRLLGFMAPGTYRGVTSDDQPCELALYTLVGWTFAEREYSTSRPFRRPS